MLLDEIDKFVTHRDEKPYNILLNVLEAENAEALLDEYLRVRFDASRACIVATANDVSVLPDFIRDRFLIVPIVAPTGADLLDGLVCPRIVWLVRHHLRSLACAQGPRAVAFDAATRSAILSCCADATLVAATRARGCCRSAKLSRWWSITPRRSRSTARPTISDWTDRMPPTKISRRDRWWV